MSMSIKIKDADDKEFTLTFTLRTIRQMSDNGFNIQEVSDNPISGVPKLFAGAFLKNHRSTPQDKIDELWAQIDDKDGFIGALVDLYREPVNKLFSNPEEDGKKATWEVVK